MKLTLTYRPIPTQLKSEWCIMVDFQSFYSCNSSKICDKDQILQGFGLGAVFR